MPKRTTLLFAAIPLGATIALTLSARASMGSSSAPTPTPFASTQLVKIFDKPGTIETYFNLRSRYTEHYSANGMADGTAEFHLLRPNTDPKQVEGISADSHSSSTWYDYWHAVPRYALPYHSPFPFDVQSVHVGIGELFTPRVLEIATAVPDGQNYRVDIRIRSDAANYLSGIPASKPGYDQLDWFGETIDVTMPKTEMMAVLVADNIAYLPFSVTDIVENGMYGVSITVADDLDQQEAQLLVTRLGF